MYSFLITRKMDIETRDFVLCKDGVLVTIFCLFFTLLSDMQIGLTIYNLFGLVNIVAEMLSLHVNIFKIFYTIIIIK